MPDLTHEVFNQPEPLFAAFCDSRLAGIWGHAFGTLGAGHRLRRHHHSGHAALRLQRTPKGKTCPT
jgi:hypothetical protein